MKREDGFTLIELLIVMIVVGVLAKIAVPTLLNQRARAHDSSTKSGLSAVGKEIATYFVDHPGPLTLDMTAVPGQMLISDGAWSTTVNLTHGVAFPTSGAWSDLDDPAAWCVSLTSPRGELEDFKFSATNGLEAGTC